MNESIILQELLRSIGKTFFVKNYKDLKSVDYKEIFNNNKQIKSNESIYTRVSKSRKIFSEKEGINALRICSESKIPSKIQNEAKKLIQFEQTEIISRDTNTQINLSKNLEYYIKPTLINEDFNVVEVLAAVVKRMKSDGLIRSNKITGDLGEYYVKEYYSKNQDLSSLELSKDKSEKGFDAEDDLGKRYQIKTITQYQTGDIKHVDGEETLFDYLIICKLDSNYALDEIFQLTWNDFLENRKGRGKDKYCLKINKKLLTGGYKVY